MEKFERLKRQLNMISEDVNMDEDVETTYDVVTVTKRNNKTGEESVVSVSAVVKGEDYELDVNTSGEITCLPSRKEEELNNIRERG